MLISLRISASKLPSADSRAMQCDALPMLGKVAEYSEPQWVSLLSFTSDRPRNFQA